MEVATINSYLVADLNACDTELSEACDLYDDSNARAEAPPSAARCVLEACMLLLKLLVDGAERWTSGELTADAVAKISRQN